MSDTFVSHLECSISGKRYEAGRPHGLSEAGRPLLVRYDLETMKEKLDRAALAASTAPGFWRYASMLPVEKPENRVSLGEVMTPIIPLAASAAGLGGKPGHVLVKDEG
ncbi:MAG: threonine synthase, partial [Pseudomonadota bacterium]